VLSCISGTGEDCAREHETGNRKKRKKRNRIITRPPLR
jgi:hypothetical protein